MFVTEQYTLLSAVNHYIEQHRYEVIYISKNRDEYILQKYENRVNRVLRFKRQTFDWSNHLKRDIEQRVSSLLRQRQLMKGKEVHIHFIYISDLVPVDDWERFKTTTPIKSKKAVDVAIYYLDQHERENEWNRLIQNINEGNPDLLSKHPSIDEQERQTMYLEQKIQADLYKKQREFRDVFQRGKPRLTYLLLGINVLVFLLLEMNGSSTNVPNLIEWGAKFNPAIADGEWWRIITSMFLHIGFLHILMNMVALYYLGDLTERIYDTPRFFFIYMVAGIFGGLASYATNDSVAAGASGAIFGLFGALLFFGMHHKEIFFRTMGVDVLVVIGINIVFGLMVPQIDNGAHIGGLIGGFIASQIVHLPNKRAMFKQGIAFILILILMGSMFTIGTKQAHSSANPETLGSLSYHYLEEGEYDRVLDILEKPLQSGLEKDYLFFYRSIAHIRLANIDSAKEDLIQTIEINPNFTDAYYNLGIIYIKENNLKQAKTHIQKAFELAPDNQQIKDMYQELNDLS
ncbi:rhomboid family protein [Tenuibacillus multivorans]|uniref:Rhomboid protease GluP n=1 Tax=Tenuibacillus multivorans TaxID=237069 RepID=A0A1G9ZCF6_9BACI|nr:rhomboid family intramembrane serine protease [Tenuibacillus multivorans]GEL77331.1 rhomboid protease GluP [Tenuibacillus multivorans]SDN18296.1 rhomboid protease GluP [Tenuibacillus multivorans]